MRTNEHKNTPAPRFVGFLVGLGVKPHSESQLVTTLNSVYWMPPLALGLIFGHFEGLLSAIAARDSPSLLSSKINTTHSENGVMSYATKCAREGARFLSGDNDTRGSQGVGGY